MLQVSVAGRNTEGQIAHALTKFTMVPTAVLQQIQCAFVQALHETWVCFQCHYQTTWWKAVNSTPDIFHSSKSIKTEVWTHFGYFKSADGKLIEDD